MNIIHSLKLTVRPCKSIVGRLLCWGELLVLGRVIHHSSKPRQREVFGPCAASALPVGLDETCHPGSTRRSVGGNPPPCHVEGWTRLDCSERGFRDKKPIIIQYFLPDFMGWWFRTPLIKALFLGGVVGNNGSTLQSYDAFRFWVAIFQVMVAAPLCSSKPSRWRRNEVRMIKHRGSLTSTRTGWEGTWDGSNDSVIQLVIGWARWWL